MEFTWTDWLILVFFLFLTTYVLLDYFPFRRLLMWAAQKVLLTSVNNPQLTNLVSLFETTLASLDEPKEKAKETKTEVIITPKYVMITYNHGSGRYTFRVPILNISPKYMDVRVYLKEGEKLSNITQELGIPYFITAACLGGDSIVLKYENKEVDIGREIIPTYELMENLFFTDVNPAIRDENLSPEDEKKCSQGLAEATELINDLNGMMEKNISVFEKMREEFKVKETT